MSFNYRDLVLAQLERHGIKPSAETPPELVREYVNDLYLYQIRRLKAKMKAGEFPKDLYAGEVAKLRSRYPLLSLPIRFWTTRLD